MPLRLIPSVSFADSSPYTIRGAISSINYNMPMRCLGYASRTLEMLAGAKGLYGSQLVELPAPEFYTFYAGNAEWESKQLRLSECFLAEPKENSLELVVNVINLNYPKQNPILTKSPSLMGYSKLLYYIRSYTADTGGDLKAAIDKAVKQCMQEGLITDFLEKYTGEVTGMLFTEITAEEFAEIRAREAYGDGKREGLSEGISKGRQEGRNESQREIAKEMLAEGIELSRIAKITKLSINEIETL